MNDANLTSTNPPVADSVPVAGAASAARSKRARWFELALVLAVVFLRPLAGSVNSYMTGHQTFGGTTPLGWIVGTVSQIVSIVFLGYVLARSGRTFRDIGLGWSWRGCGYGILLGVAGLLAVGFGSVMLKGVLHAVGVNVAFPSTHYWGRDTFLTRWSIPYLLVTPFLEEIFVRAYLMTELLELTGSAVIAVGASVIFQASYHIYYGWFGAASVAFIFLVFALYFVKARRALPCVVGHEVYDLIVTLVAHFH